MMLRARTRDHLQDIYQNSHVYHELAARARARNPLSSSQLMSPYPGLGFDASIDDVLSDLGEPDHDLVFSNALNIRLLFYRLVVAGYKMHYEFHFSHDRLLCAKRTFRSTNPADDRQIIKAIESKYLDSHGTLNADEDKIIDPKGNALLVARAPYLVVDYLQAQLMTLSDPSSRATQDSTSTMGLSQIL
jgi:hypothetical protein